METVALCMIAGGADPLGSGLERAIRSVRPYVDEVAVWANGPQAEAVVAALRTLDTGASEAPIRVECGEWANDYSAARAASFAMTRADWLMFIDCDDELRGGENLRELIERARDASTIYVTQDYGEWPWGPRIFRRGSGHWQGVVHETWIRADGFPSWRRGVGSPYSVYAHPARLHVYHCDRDRTKYDTKYNAELWEASDDLATTPWAALMIEDQMSDDGLIAWYEDVLAEGWMEWDGPLNYWRIHLLLRLFVIYGRNRRWSDAARVMSECETYSASVIASLGRDEPFFSSLQDTERTASLASVAPQGVDVILDPKEWQ